MKPITGDIVYGKGTTTCVRTNCITGEESTVNLEYYAKYGTGFHWWFYLVGGPTGYESFDMDSEHFELGKGWHACAGTPKRWDTLFVPGYELEAAVFILRERLKGA